MKPRGSSGSITPQQPPQGHPLGPSPPSLSDDGLHRDKASPRCSLLVKRQGQHHLPSRANVSRAEQSLQWNLPSAGQQHHAIGFKRSLCHMLLLSHKLHQKPSRAMRQGRTAQPREWRPAWKSGRGRRDEPKGKQLELL